MRHLWADDEGRYWTLTEIVEYAVDELGLEPIMYCSLCDGHLEATSELPICERCQATAKAHGRLEHEREDQAKVRIGADNCLTSLRTLECLDLFCGAGGLSLGLKRAGFDPALAVDIDEDSCETFSAAFGDVDLRDAPIDEVDFTTYRGIQLVAGGPPCQPFSSGGKRLGRQDDRDVTPQFVRAIREARPEAFLMENVPGLTRGKRRAYFESLLSNLEDLDYSVEWKIVNAARYGVPQKRKRLFVVGFRKGRFEFPDPTHGPGSPEPFIPAGSVLDPHEPFGEPNPSIVTFAKRPDTRPNWWDGHLFNGGGRPINLDEPCHTILASAGGNKTHFLDQSGLVPRYHQHLLDGGEPRSGTVPDTRRITAEESALIQTFPSDMQFFGSRSSKYTQIGNAVPPKLAQVLGKAIREQLT